MKLSKILTFVGFAFAPLTGSAQDIFDIPNQTVVAYTQYVSSIDVGDGELDGDVDIALAGNLRADGFIKNDGDGILNYETFFWRGHREHRTQIALADFDGDNDLDAFVAGDWFGVYKVEAPSFTSVVVDPNSSRSLAVGDVSGDGIADVVVSFYSGTKIFVSDGTGGLSLAQTLPLSAQEYSLALGDVDNDGDLDLAISNFIYINDGFGAFVDSGVNVITGVAGRVWGRVFSDLDNDGDQDLFYGDVDSGSFPLLNDGSGRFTWNGTRISKAYGVALGDVDGDGIVDAVSSGAHGADAPGVNVHIGNGDGTFGPTVQTIPVGNAQSYEVKLADINGDGMLDLVHSTSAQGYPTYYLNLISPPPNYECFGFESPMANFPVKAKKNRVFPLKITLVDEEGFEITESGILAPPVVQVLFSSSSNTNATDVSDQALSSGQGMEGNQFEWSTDGLWRFNLQSKNYTAFGEYHVTVISGDETEYKISPSCVTSFVIE